MTSEGKFPSRSQPVTFRGVTMLLQDWCDTLQVPYGTIYGRLRAGMSIDEAFTKPIGRSLQSGRPGRKIVIPPHILDRGKTG